MYMRGCLITRSEEELFAWWTLLRMGLIGLMGVRHMHGKLDYLVLIIWKRNCFRWVTNLHCASDKINTRKAVLAPPLKDMN